jgi:PAS domain S-box-containing protein
VSCFLRPDRQPVPLIPVRLSERGVGVGFTDPSLQKVKKMFTESEDQIHDQKSATTEPLPHINVVATGLFDYNLISDSVIFSLGFKRQLGFQDEEFPNDFHEWENRLHPEDGERVMQSWRAYLAEPQLCYEVEYRLRHKDGAYRSMLARAEVIRDADGRPCRMFGCQLDLTERHRAEEDRARLAAIVLSSDDAIVGKTLDGIVTSWNAGAERLFGYAAEEMVGQPVSRIIPGDRLAEEPDILSRLRHGERVEHFETVRRHQDGSLVEVSVSISPIKDTTGRIIGASKIARDVGERKRAEAAVEQANERLVEQAMVLELAPVLVRDMNNRIVLWSSGAQRLYGFSKEEALGSISHELFRTRFPVSRAQFEKMLRKTGRWEGELVHRKRDGKQLVVTSQQIVYHDRSGRPTRILEANADITERQRAEAELSQSQDQLRALTERLVKAREEEAIRIARELHDQLGRCLTTIKMDVRSMERDLAGEISSAKFYTLREKVRTVEQAVDETVQTVRAIATRLRPGLLDDLGLAAALEWQAEEFQKRSGILCSLAPPAKDPPVNRDQATALFRIFQEILTNVARHAQATKVWVHLGEEDQAIELEVEDNGVGIKDTQLAKRHSLGLLGMRERAAAFGGTVEIAGVPNQGTIVRVRLPVLKTTDENSDR